MPNPKDYKDESEWMAACVPVRVGEGDAQDQAVAACSSMWQNKSIESTEDIKVGARHTRKEVEAFQTVHDIMVNNGAMCKTVDGKSEPVEEVIAFGAPLKAVKLDDGSVKLGGYLVGFSNAKSTDLTGDFFDNLTDYGDATESDVYLNHRLPIEADGVAVDYKSRLGKAKLIRDDVGIFAETILKARNAYEKMIAELGLAGALSWSSGTAGHLVEREPVGKAYHITAWPIGLDASLTPTPAEYRNQVIPLKSFIPSASGMTETDDKKNEQPIEKESDMDKEELKALLADNNKIVVDTVKDIVKAEAETAAKKAVDDVLDKLPEVKAKLSGKIEFGEQPEDRPFKSLWDNLNAVKMATMSGAQRAEDQYPRMKYLNLATKATGASEGVPMDGGALLEPTLTAEIIKPMNETGSFTQYIRPLPVSTNSNSGWINGVDETSRATGSRWGGIRGYRGAEGGALTASKPTFRRIQWELKKYHCLTVATDELMSDSGQFERIVSEGVGEELSFMVNDDIMNGMGLAGAQGFIQSGAFLVPTRTDANLILGADISVMYNRMNLRGRNNGIWYVGNDSQPQLDKLFAPGSTAVLFPFASYGPDGVRRLYNRPVVTTEYNATLGTAGDIVFVDPTQYLFWEKQVQAATSIHVYFTTDEFAWRWTYRADGKSSVASALTPYKGSTTTSPFVGLLATS